MFGESRFACASPSSANTIGYARTVEIYNARFVVVTFGLKYLLRGRFEK